VQTSFNYKHYLQRIGIAPNSIIMPDFATLKRLILQHLLHIPFENIDIIYKQPISLELDDIFQKIVSNNRGGYCYECNFLFYNLLKILGYNCHLISASAVHAHTIGQPFDHLALVVVIEEKEWLVDVGYGLFSATPLLIQDGYVAEDMKYSVKLFGELYNAKYWTANRITDNNAINPVYHFCVQPYTIEDFFEMHNFHQTSPLSKFTSNIICSKMTEYGRISIVGNRMIATNGSQKNIVHLYDESQLFAALKTHFNILLNLKKSFSLTTV
jgi:N-hydroxyarylamine O-acetyltransferase